MQRSGRNPAAIAPPLDTGDVLENFDFDAFLESGDTSGESGFSELRPERFDLVEGPEAGLQDLRSQLSAAQKLPPNLTVSDDQSDVEKIEERNLLALRDRVEEAGTGAANDGTAAQLAQNRAFQSHSRQLMMLEQQNQRRLQQARQEQDNPRGILPAFPDSSPQPASANKIKPHQQASDTQVRNYDIHGVLRDGPVLPADPEAIRRSLREDPMDSVHTRQTGFRGWGGGESPQNTANHALQDYQMQTMLLEQQNKKRLLMARQEQPKAAAAQRRGPPSSEKPVALTKDIDDMDVDEIGNYIERLQKRAKYLGAGELKSDTPRQHTLYRIQNAGYMTPDPGCTLYFDPPEVMTGQNGMRSLRSNIPVENFDLFLEQNKDVVFLTYKTYVVPENSSEQDALPQIRESVRPLAPVLKHALEKELKSQKDYADILQSFRDSHELQAPFIFLYHNRRVLDEMQSAGDPQLSLFSRYIAETCGPEYAIADALITDGLITPDYVKYLFKPGDVLVYHQGGKDEGRMARSWPQSEGEERLTRVEAESKKLGDGSMPYTSTKSSADVANDTVLVHSWYLETSHWDFDGNFARQYNTLRFSIHTDIVEDSAKGPRAKDSLTIEEKIEQIKKKAIAIRSLAVQPFRHAEHAIAEKLKKRGKMFWTCRKRRFVSYQENDTSNTQSAIHERYVIDLKTYRSLHKLGQTGLGLRDELGPAALAKDQPPDEVFELLMPLKIKGYNLRRKKWYDLEVDRMSDVMWNKEAFSKVVIDRKAKDLIRALVEKQLAADVATDLIPGKGNGLILLLHGSPGTGKTLTAESVAEICQKPLYSVTCGDVGTKAEDVEKYLESVFYLGKLWDCVVLLDEADVFLEQRSLEDLQRNALVSVFLRMLEYYEGILILTSNRVGTFDEAFKSRIQLALHYPILGPLQRLCIWENLIDRLESFKDNTIDIVDLRNHLDALKNEKMNGRQIRNAITTARQYSQWKGKRLTYEELRDVIDVAGRFDKYLDNLHYGRDRLGEDERTSVGFVSVADTESSSSTM